HPATAPLLHPASGAARVQITRDTPTVGGSEDLPGMPAPLCDGRAWIGFILGSDEDGSSIAYLIPTPSGTGWHVVTIKNRADSWATTTCAVKHWAARILLTQQFDIESAIWSPCPDFAPAEVNPWLREMMVAEITEGLERLSEELRQL